MSMIWVWFIELVGKTQYNSFDEESENFEDLGRLISDENPQVLV